MRVGQGLIGVLSATVLSAAVGSCAFASSPADAIPHFKVKACTNLGNSLEAPEEGDWGLTIEAHHLDIIKNAGFDTVRVPVRWSAHAMDEAPYLIDLGFLDRVTEVVDLAMERDLAVVLNLHHYEELSENTPAHRERYLAIWEQVAEHFRARDLSLHFELLNEPTGNLKGVQLQQLLTEAIKRVRKTNPDRALIVGGADWNSLKGLEELAPIDDKNVVATFHYYAPHEFTHQGAEFLEKPPEEGTSWGSDADRLRLAEDAIRAAAQMAQRKGPVFLGEFGVFLDVPAEQRLSYYKSVRETFEAQQIGWCAWDFATNFGLWDSKKETWRPGVLQALGLGNTQSTD